MRFLIDAQLSPALAAQLRAVGHEAEHVNQIGLGAAPDRRIWAFAAARQAVLISKDEDFADLTRRDPDGAAVIWIRFGNTTSKAAWRAIESALPEILEGLGHGERLIEVI